MRRKGKSTKEKTLPSNRIQNGKAVAAFRTFHNGPLTLSVNERNVMIVGGQRLRKM